MKYLLITWIICWLVTSFIILRKDLKNIIKMRSYIVSMTTFCLTMWPFYWICEYIEYKRDKERKEWKKTV